MPADIETLPPAMSETDLASAVLEGSERFSSAAALKELARRRSSNRTEVLTRVLADEGRPADLRATAAVELGRERAPAHQKSLIEALRSPEPNVTRRAAEALGRIGDEEALDVLLALRPGLEPVRRGVHFARTLIAYRLGLDRERLPDLTAERMLPFDRGQAIALEVDPVPAASLERIGPTLRRQLPGLTIEPEGALRFACGGTEFLVVRTRHIQGAEKLTEVAEHNAVPAVVLRRSSPGNHSVYQYVLTHPRADGELALFGLREGGIVALSGSVRLEDRSMTFEVHATRTRYVPPVLIQGAYDHTQRQLTFTQALVHRDFSAAQKEATASPPRMKPSTAR